MYADNSLTPRETIRLCALGTLAIQNAEQLMMYDDLVFAVRHFISRISGPSLDLMGESIELLRYEGLVKILDTDNTSNPRIIITTEGRAVLKTLLLAKIRAGNSDLNKLITALKFRFLHLLPIENQIEQSDNFLEICDTELTRLKDLLKFHEGDEGDLIEWLKNDIKLLNSRMEWLLSFRASLDNKL